jgi:hypothetical protein
MVLLNCHCESFKERKKERKKERNRTKEKKMSEEAGGRSE